jgi:hypothetical protein
MFLGPVTQHGPHSASHVQVKLYYKKNEHVIRQREANEPSLTNRYLR